MALIKQSKDEISDYTHPETDVDFSLEQFDLDIHSQDRACMRRALTQMLDAGSEAFNQRRSEVISLAKSPDNQEISDLGFRVLERFMDDSLIMTMLSMLESDSPYIRNQAIELLQQCSELLAPHMMSLLTHADPDVRIFSLDILGMLPHKKVPEWLEYVMVHDDHINVIGAAIDRVSQLSEPSLLPAVMNVRERFSDVAYISFACDIAIKRLNA